MKQRSNQSIESDLSSRFAHLTPAKQALLEQRLKGKGLDSLVSRSISPRATAESAPLSYSQQRLWFLDQYEPDNSVYNVASAVRLKGRLDSGALEQSLKEIVKRHESLRTTFSVVEGEPVQVIAPSVEHTLDVADLREGVQSEREEQGQRVCEEEARRPFELGRGPLFRSLLIRLGEDDQILLLTMHHIVSDGWSMGVLNRELTVLYRAFCNGECSPLTPLPIQYGDYAAWQREWMKGEVLESQLRYWKKQLEGMPAVLNLPTDRARPAVQSFRGNRQTLELSKELTEGLKELSRKRGVTLYMTLLAAFQTLLYRYTGQEDIVVGSPIANRNRTEVEGLIGFFVNTLVLHSNFSDNPTFKELLARVREMALGAYAHQDLPFEKLVEELKPERSLSHSPLFQAMFVLQNAWRTTLTFEGLSASPVWIEAETAKFDLLLSTAENTGRLSGSLQYNTDLFDAATIDRWLGHFQILLEGIIENPGRRISDLPLMTQAEQHQLIIEWNNTEKEYPKNTCVHQLFEEQVEKSPDAVAVTFEDQQLTYRELNARANQLAHYLQELGVGPEVLVGICMERSLEMVIALLGILKAGGAYVPLDTEYPKERLAFMLEDAQPAVLLTQKRLLEKFPHPHARAVCLDRDWGRIAKETQENTKNKATADNIAYVVYTSGTTGQPKGVLISHHNIGRLFRATESWFHFSKNDVWTMFHSYAFDFSVWEIWGALLYGGRVVVVPFWICRSPEKFHELLCREEVTVLNQTPSAFRQLIQAEPSLSHRTDLALRLIILGGEALDFQSLQPWLDRHGDQCPQLVNMYGITETTVHVTYRVVRSSDVKQGVGSLIGVPLADLNLYVLDRHRQLVPIGIPGELYVGGAGVGRGYLNRPELTDERFVLNPFNERKTDKLYKTGDLIRRLSNGDIEYLGRTDAQVKIRGYRIELGEVESVLGQHPAVEEAVLVARDDSSGDPSASLRTDKRLVAYVIPSKKQTCTDSELRSYLKQKLPDYMVPSVFVFLDTVPLTPNGKIDRKALPAPDQNRPQPEESYVAPRTPVEEMIAEIWAEVLKLDTVGVHDNFFDLGGHSLLATQVMSRICQAFQVEISLRALFERPTVGELATHIEAAHGDEQRLSTGPMVPVSRDRDLPLSFAQQRLWFLDQYEPDSSAYNISSASRLRGSLNIGVLEQSLNEIIRRHESLRTTFSMLDGEAVQVIAPALGRSLPVVDLRDPPEGERQEEARQLAREEASRPFNLARGPLFRSKLLRLGEDDHVLLLTMHHIVSDGWSMGVLYRELSVLYEAFSQGKPSPLPDLPIQYADFAAWQREWLEGETLESQLSYWKKQLEGIPAVLDLPTDRPRPAVQSHRGARQSFVLSKDLTEQIKALSRKEGVTLFMTLLAAFQSLLHRYTDQDDIIIGTPIANRNRTEIEGLIGFFVNTLVLRTKFDGDPAFKELLARMQEMALGAYAHQDLPFEKLVDELKPERSLSHSPLFQVMFVLQNAPTSSLIFEGLRTAPLPIGAETAKFDLALTMSETAQGLRGMLEYDTELFDERTIRGMLGHLEVLLESIVVNPDNRISDLSILTETEKHQLLSEWNHTQRDYPSDKCIHELFEDQVEKSPDAVAVTYENQQLSYRELNSRANQLAHHLQRLGVGPEVPVGICMERSLEMVVALLGILKSGGAYVPLDPMNPKDRLDLMMHDCKISILVTHRQLLNRLPNNQPHIVWMDDDVKSISVESVTNPIIKAEPSSLAYVMYTSGTSGSPKGVMVEHKSLVNYLCWFNQTLLDNGFKSLPVSTKITFDACLKQLFAPLLTGGQAWILPEEVIDQPARLLKAIGTRDRVGLNCVPSLWNALLDGFDSNQDFKSTETLSVLFLGGEPLNKKVIERTFTILPDVEIWNLYGPTEATANSVVGKIGHTSPITLGRPIANTEIYILDAGLQPVPIGVAGEICIGGLGLARGYLSRPDLTAESFVGNPFDRKMGTRLYKTGDRARYLPDGQIEYLGRVDNQVKLRGFRIELGEIECLLSQHAGVQEVVVLARENVASDPSTALMTDMCLVAYVVRVKEQPCTSSGLRAFLKKKLPEYMVPSDFVFLDSLPLDPNGKLNRKALPVPSREKAELEQRYVAPRTAAEQMLSGIWAKLLNVKRAGIHDNFFDLGGHSLLAVRLLAQIEKLTGRHLPVASLFQAPTIEDQAKLLYQERSSAAWDSLVAIQPAGSRKPFFCVHAHDGGVLFWRDLARYLGQDQPFYALQAQGLDGRQPPHSRIEEMAAHYIKEIRTLQPEGPYFIGGHCIGGLMAFEMAQQLHSHGERVALLALFDSYAPRRKSSARSSLLHRYRYKAIRLFEMTVGLHVSNLLILEPKERLAYVKGKFNKALYKLYMGLGSPWIPAARTRRKILNAGRRAARNYNPKIYPGKITLFRATDLGGGIERDPQMGWARLAGGGVETHLIPGYHAHIVLEPRVRLLAKELIASLFEAGDYGSQQFVREEQT